MKTCTCCLKDLPIGSFSPQRRDPTKMYAYCDRCLTKFEGSPRRNRRLVAQDYEKMRAKSRELRVLTYSQALEIAERRQKGAKVVELASEFKVSQAVIYKASRSPKRYE